MPKILIHYFSGTGNALLAAKQLGQELVKYGFDITFHAVEDGSRDYIDTYSLHIFCFPIYATAVPHIMLQYLRHLPDGKKAKAAVISVNGKVSTHFRDGYQGWGLHQARLFLSLKNYDPFFSETLDYPHNITVGFPPRKAKYNEKIISQASTKIPAIAEKIAGGKKFHRKFFFLNIFWSLPFGFLYSLIGRRIIGKLFAADSSCNLCGQCVKNCPVKAIQMDLKLVFWKWNCEGCLRCINSCPRQAIQASGMRYLAILVVAVVDPYFLIRRFFPGWFVSRVENLESMVFDALMNLLLSIVLFALLDWLIDKLSYIPLLRNITAWGYTRYFGRYSAKPFEGQFLNQKEKG